MIDPGPDRPEHSDSRAPVQAPWLAPRVVALLEVVLCSDYPTQAVLTATFNALGYTAYDSGELRVGFVVALSLVDTVLLLALIVFFLAAHGERARDVFFGRRPIREEIVLGLPLILVALGGGIAVLAAIQLLAPTLHTVEHNPLQDLVQRPRDAWLFAVVVVVAGGVREELQRAFLLHRFDRWLGGPAVGVVVASLAFGAGHLLQGVDAAITTGLLGAFWGVVYLRRRSAVAPIVSHSGFNLVQIVQFLLIRH